jgi:DNA polymerase
MTTGPELLARYLRQRQELGESEIVLEGDGRALLERLSHQSRPKASPGQRPAAGGAGMGSPVAGKRSPLPVVSVASGNPELDEVRAVAMGCVACGLSASRTMVVFGEGDPAARLVVVGEAPGADEDRTGRPFVGRAGRLLDNLLAAIGFSRETVYICNVLKCRPPQNRNPLPHEIEACSPFLRQQLRLIAPRVILAVGAFPAQALLATTEPIGRLRGIIHEYEGIPLVPTYHPAAVLRSPGWIRPVWEDLQRVREVLDR